MKALYLVGTLLVCTSYSYDPSKDNILCIVNYNWPFYESIPFIKKTYGQFFPHMVFYGPRAHPYVHHINHEKGYFGYKDIADAMARYPHFDGYLFMNDDCLMNAWNFKRFDCSKLWFVYISRVAFSEALKHSGWPWWSSAMGYDQLKECLNHVPAVYIKQLVHNLGIGNTAIAASDVVYIPQRLRAKALFLFNLFAKKRVFLEIAIPNICACLEDETKWEHFKALYLWDKDRERLFELYRPSLDFVHPVKLSNRFNLSFIQKQFDLYS